jgi:hypothetical protein
MATQGTATVDFGTGAYDTSVAVTGQGAITTANLVEAWMSLDATSNNLAGAALAEGLKAYAGDIINGTGFTIYVKCPNPGRAFGQYKVNWVWN